MKFEIGQRLGAGGFGEVSLALMRGKGEPQLVALKRLRPDLAETPDYVLQFEREAKISAQLDHPHVVKVAAVGTDDLGPYLALEFVHGRPASAFEAPLEKFGEPIPLEVAMCISRDAARGLAYAHQLKLGGRTGLIHRDISPDNILVAYSGMAKLADFGIARAVDQTRLTSTGGIKGKFAYMAPELFEGADADIATDIFAFGATLYRLFAGRSPFPSRNEAELLRLIAACRPARLSTHRRVPAPVEEWVMSALQKAPAYRPESVVSVLNVLDDLLHERPDEGRADVRGCMQRLWPRQASAPLPRVANAATKVKRSRSPAELATEPMKVGKPWRGPVVAVAVLGVLAAGAWWWSWASEPDPAALQAFDPEHPPEIPKQRPFEKMVTEAAEQFDKKPPKPAAPTRIDVNVTSEPPGATVQLEGVKLPGKTPLVLEGLRPGTTYHLDVFLPGHYAWSQTFVADGHAVAATLQPLPVKK